MRPKQPPEQLFWSKVQKGEPDQCWLWQGGKRGQYGSGWLNGRKLGAHQVSWILHFGEIPKGLDVLHKCDVPMCVNPAHLFLGTHQDNMRDMARKGRNKGYRGEDLSYSKLKEDQVREIRKLIAEGKTHREIAKQFGVTNPLISRIRNRKNWMHIE